MMNQRNEAPAETPSTDETPPTDQTPSTEETPSTDELTSLEELSGPSTDRNALSDIDHEFAGAQISPDQVNNEDFKDCNFSSSVWSGEYTNVHFVESCDGNKMRIEGATLVNFNADGLNKIGTIYETTIGEGTLLKNLDQRGATMANLSFILDGKKMTGEELLAHAKSSDTGKEQVETYLKEVLQGTVWDHTTKMDEFTRELLQMVSKPIENPLVCGTFMTSKQVLEDAINQGKILEGEYHDLSKRTKLSVPGEPDLEIWIKPKKKISDTLLLRKHEPEQFIIEVIDKSGSKRSLMEVVGHKGERKAKPLSFLGIGKGKDLSKPLSYEDVFDLLADLARLQSNTVSRVQENTSSGNRSIPPDETGGADTERADTDRADTERADIGEEATEEEATDEARDVEEDAEKD